MTTSPTDSMLQSLYADRLSELAQAAVEEDICQPSNESKRDFFEFLSTRGFGVRRAGLALLDDGLLCATWRNGKWRLGLTFLGKGQVKYVLLDRTNPPMGENGTSSLKSFAIVREGLVLKELLAE